MTKSDFVHLHVHTEFSLLDGQSKIKKITQRAAELNMDALAITDHGVMFGAIDFFRAAKSAEIKPIIGMEAYLAPRSRFDKDPQLDKKPYHLLLLARNMEGYRNLLKLASAAQLEGYYYRPRIDWEILEQHAEGVVATSGCLAAEIPRMVEGGRDEQAYELIGKYQEVFGAENFYLELQPHEIDQLHVLNQWLFDYRQSGHTPVQLLATNDVHYVKKEDWDAHDTLLCIQTNATKSETNRMRMNPQDSYYLKTTEEMRTEFGDAPPEMIQEAFANTLKVAELCDVDLSTEGYHLPVFPVPEGFDEASYLRYLVHMGLDWRFQERKNEKVLQDRIERELGIIHDMGFDTYFLIVWDLCEFARHADIWWNVRGSGAGSLVAYCLGITNIDPIQNSLLFERFLNPGRVSMPDIDLDYPDDRRGEMIAYTASKYGEDKVAAIITFGTMGAKAAIRDVGRALDVPLPTINKAVSLIPTEARQKKIQEYVDANPELKVMVDQDPELKLVIDTAIELQGMTRHASTHAAGVIVSDAPLVNYLPLHRITGTDPSGGSLKAVTQFPMETAESIGLLKVDFLGLSTLTILRKACDLIEKHQDIKYTMDTIPYRHDDDKVTNEQRDMLDEAFRMMGRGETVGVFQVESGGMQQMLRGMRPQKFEHIIAGISLYRPGPMDFIPTYNKRLHGEEDTKFLHEKLAPILAETYGILVYQEQIMQVAGELFGYDLGEADLMRRAVSKKKKQALLEHKQIFMERGPENGIPAEVSEEIFDEIEFFANYGFNKCVVGDTEIIDADTGRVHTIQSLFDGDVQIKRTFSLNTDNLRLQPANIVEVMANGVKPVYRLTTQTGRSIEATANHPFYCFDGWYNLEDLHVGDQIAIAPQSEEMSETVVQAHKIAASSLDSNLKYANYSGYEIDWDKIASIEYVGEQLTYDLTIADTHNFVANDIIVHNSHASDYAVITVQTAFLKTHYPEEYMTALLCVQFDDSTKVATFLDECRRLNIEILPPDLNKSMIDFDIETKPDGQRAIRFGLGAIKNAGVSSLEYLLAQRTEHGEFPTLEEFCHQVDLRILGKRTLESLIKVGALDNFATRHALHDALDRIVGFSADYHKDLEVGQMNMFGDMMGGEMNMLNLPQTDEISNAQRREQLQWERELLGLYVTGRPVDRYKEQLRHQNTRAIEELKNPDISNPESVQVAGEIMAIRHIITKNNENMAVLQLEDWHESGGAIDVVLFPRTYRKIKAEFDEMERELIEGEIVMVMGKFDTSRGDPQIIAERITTNFDVFVPQDNQQDNHFTDQQPAWMDDAPPPEFFEDSNSTIASSQEPPPMFTNGNGHSNQDDYYSQTNGSGDLNEEPVWANGHDDEDTIILDLHVDDVINTSYALKVFFSRSDDTERDRRRLRRIHRTLMQYPGNDQFSIVIKTHTGNLPIEFPKQTTGYCDELMNKLIEIVGEDNIELTTSEG